MRIGLDQNKIKQEEFSSFEELEASQENNKGAPAKKEVNKMYLMCGGIAVAIIVIILIVISMSKQKNNTTSLEDGTTAEVNVTTDGTDNGITSNEEDAISSDINSLQNTISEQSGINNQIASNENVILDEEGNVISENGIYDEDGNYVSDSENIIKPGIEEYTQEGGTTTPIVYSADDFIKDLNGVDVNAIYNPKSYSYIYDYVNYEKRRAIMDDGMELYWLDITYHGKQYRCTTPFYIFKSLSNEGICRVKLELLTVEGGGKIISYMRVAEPDEE